MKISKSKLTIGFFGFLLIGLGFWIFIEKIKHSITGEVYCLAVSPNSRYVLSGNQDQTVRLWDLERGKEIYCFEGHAGKVQQVVFSPDGHSFASSAGNTILLWEIESKKEIRRFKGHTRIITGLVFSPDGKYLVSGSADRTIRIWNVAAGQETRRLSVPVKPGTSQTDSLNELVHVVVSRDGRNILAGNWNGSVCWWNFESGDLIRHFEENQGHLLALALSFDGRLVALGGDDSTIRICDVTSGQVLHTLSAHSTQPYSTGVLSLAFSNDNRFMVSGGMDGTVRLWDVAQAREFRCLKKHTGPVACVVFTPDNRRVLSSGYDQMVYLWDVETGNEIGHLGTFIPWD